MIKVIEGLKVKSFAEVEPILQKIRRNVIQCPGFVSDEYLIGYTDDSRVVILSVWHNFSTWKLWEDSKIRRKLFEEMQELMEEEPRTTIYIIHPSKLPATSRQ
jgi:heme-degrading monooxygenase HmoA